MNVLAFAASNSSTSINKALVRHACDVLSSLSPEVNIDMIDLNDFEMPIYSMDREKSSGIPELAKQFLSKIEQADALLISYAEHNGLYTVAYKNIFDWASRLGRDIFKNKPMVIMSASPGKGGGANVLKVAREAAPHFSGQVLASFSVGPFGEKFDETQNKLIDTELANTLEQALGQLLNIQ